MSRTKNESSVVTDAPEAIDPFEGVTLVAPILQHVRRLFGPLLPWTAESRQAVEELARLENIVQRYGHSE